MRTCFIVQGTPMVLNGGLNGKEIQKRRAIYIYVWLICFAVQQKPTQQCKATIPQ